MPILADLVQVVIGVDTHKHTHTAAVLTAATGQILATHTVPTTPAGYGTLRALADQHPGPRIWAIEGTGGYGADWCSCWPPMKRGLWSWTARPGQPAAMGPSPTC